MQACTERKRSADSNSKCKNNGILNTELKEPVFWSIEHQFSPGSPVDFVLDLLDGIIRDVLKSVPFGKYCLTSLLACSTAPFCHEE